VFKHQRGDWQAATRLRDKLISLRRAINNGWYDDEKQGAINLFLGHFQPRLGQSELWNLDSDHYLHSGAHFIAWMSQHDRALKVRMGWTGWQTCQDLWCLGWIRLFCRTLMDRSLRKIFAMALLTVWRCDCIFFLS
jgi:hypothetical protein